MDYGFFLGWGLGFITAVAGAAFLLALLKVGSARDDEDGDGIQDDFTPAIARWNRMGRRWGWL